MITIASGNAEQQRLDAAVFLFERTGALAAHRSVLLTTVGTDSERRGSAAALALACLLALTFRALDVRSL